MEPLNEQNVLAIFEDLVKEDVLAYAPYDVVRNDFDGFPIEFRICPSLRKKPNTVGATLDPSFDKARKWGPGSDLYVPDERMVLARIGNGNTHELAFNLFCVDKPQLIFVTVDSYQRQHEPLNNSDFAAALEILHRFPSMYVIYNCAEAGGCSRLHKHLQALRGPPAAFQAFVGVNKSNSPVPFEFFTHHCSNGFGETSAEDMTQSYDKLLDQARIALGISSEDICPHNLVLWDDWIIVIPRRTAFVGKASTNTAGMMGSVWASDQSTVDEWLRIGPLNVLTGLGMTRQTE